MALFAPPAFRDNRAMREFYSFRYFDPLRQRWIGARYRAEVDVIRDRYEKWELIGAPELRGDDPAPSCSSPPRGSPEP